MGLDSTGRLASRLAFPFKVYAPEMCLICTSGHHCVSWPWNWADGMISRVTGTLRFRLGPDSEDRRVAACRCPTLHTVYCLWHADAKLLCMGKSSLCNCTAALWWLRTMMGTFCSQSTLIHRFHWGTLFFSLFLSLLDRSVVCGSLHHSHVSRNEVKYCPCP